MMNHDSVEDQGMIPQQNRIGTALLLGVMLAPLFFSTAGAAEVAVRDIANIGGVRSNQLIGYGLVVGLEGTGDKSATGFTDQTVSNLLERVGLHVPREALKVRNVAAVVVTAELGAFARSGTRIDVTVSSLGDATSLEGGVLLQTPLRAANDTVYAVAQGPMTVGGFNVDSGTGTRFQQNHVTAGLIPAGAIVERTVAGVVGEGGRLEILLDEPDFLTASRVAAAINRRYGGARAIDGGLIEVDFAGDLSTDDRVRLIGGIESLTVEPVPVARVVINERTGTVIAGGAVQILPVAISHGNLTIRIQTRSQISQPSPFSDRGSTVVVPESDVQVDLGGGTVAVISEAPTVQDIAEALNALAVRPRDLIAIFTALKRVGALKAELTVM
jgi:flagellar P-ring protein precursor FlgI